MFYWTNGVYFGRRSDGSVRIVKFATSPSDWPQADGLFSEEVIFDVTIPPSQWASVVCSVSALGETGERWDAAQDFHGRP